MPSVFRRAGRKSGPWQCKFLDRRGRWVERSTRTSHKRSAERIAARWEEDEALRRTGVIDTRQEELADARKLPLQVLIDEYQAELERAGKSRQYQSDSRRHLQSFVAATLGDLTREVVLEKLDALKIDGRSARTINSYLESASRFCRWLMRTGRLPTDPCVSIPKLEVARDRKRIRRALSDAEVARLLEVTKGTERRLVYLLGLYAGLRRSEIHRLTWDAVDLEAGTITIGDHRVAGKAKRVDVIPLHTDLLQVLRETAGGAGAVTPHLTNDQRREDFEAAEIPLVDEEGRHADFHCLRSTLGTWLARRGTAPQLAQRIMRHANYQTTLAYYTDLSTADTAPAVKALPSFGEGRG